MILEEDLSRVCLETLPMNYRKYIPRKDREAILRIFREVEWIDKEKKCGFPCVCGAKNYEDAADKCEGISDENICPATCMFDNYIAVDPK